ncbi:MAG: tetratricopeptide repeat protein, partial [Candidatus Hydrogenedentes bacterium]|nr:tetratricopeptide repeat protein [Candidatus Hydrogenedentota bacterium]
RDDAYANLVREQFEYNLTRMVVLADDAGVPILFVTPPSNLRDCSPFKSEPREGLSEDAYAQFRSDLNRARTFINEGKLPDALTALDDCLNIDDGYAEAHFLRGRIFWKRGEYENARSSFERARDEDVCPLRATGPLLATIDQVVSKEIANAIDFESMIGDLSEHGIPGNDWFLDHVHPTIEGNRRLSLSIVERLIDTGVATPVASWNAEAIASVKTRVESQLDAVEHGRALLTVAQVYLWGGKFEEARTAADRALAMAPEDWMPYYVLASLAHMTGNLDEAIEWQRQAVELNREYELLRRQLEELETMREMAESGGEM